VTAVVHIIDKLCLIREKKKQNMRQIKNWHSWASHQTYNDL